MATLSDIKRIVVLMLENRSFDSMLGQLRTASEAFNGLSGEESNPLHDQADVSVWTSSATDALAMSTPTPDPGELWTDSNMQLFGLDGRPGYLPPTMNGFVNNYVRQTEQPSTNYSPKSVMHYYSPAQLPVMSLLAQQFAVCDQWFASAPCQTWPNRFFLHTGSAGGYENNSPVHFPYLMNSVFNRLSEVGKPWKIYFHDFPQTLTLTRLWPHVENFRPFKEFLSDAEAGNLPAYSFIEPRYFPDIELPNDQHPPHNVGMGEQLIASVYNAVRSSPQWKETLLIITYDEHGGCYDHAAPPLAIPPDTSNAKPFGFDRYGVRVPALLISPFIKAGTVLRVTPDRCLPHQGPPHPFDHTSVISTLRKCFTLGPPLSNRDAVAPNLESVLNLALPENDGPAAVSALNYAATPGELQDALNAPLNGMQKALHEAAAHLPNIENLQQKESIFREIETHVESLVHGFLPQVPNHQTPADALLFIKQQLKSFGL
ncbi:MAG: sulfatase family protein [Verrucomicrobiaceae bacterium]|nr:sulfatase family protein [Verrucomicrobiaceae bacterium]